MPESRSLTSRSRIVLEGRKRQGYVDGSDEPITYGVVGETHDDDAPDHQADLPAPMHHIVAAVGG